MINVKSQNVSIYNDNKHMIITVAGLLFATGTGMLESGPWKLVD